MLNRFLLLLCLLNIFKIIFSCASSGKKIIPDFDVTTIKVGKGAGSVEVADFNKDGFPDIAVANAEDSSVTILLGDGKGKFTESAGSPFFSNRFPSDIVTTNLEGNNATVLLGMGDGKFRESQGSPFPAGDAPFGVAIGDVNGDNNPDLAIANSPTITAESKGKDGLTILINDGSGRFSPLKGSPFQTGKSPSRVAVGDRDGNGINDIAVTNYNDKSITIFYMDKKGVASGKSIKVGSRPDGIAIHDMNNDGKNDILVIIMIVLL